MQRQFMVFFALLMPAPFVVLPPAGAGRVHAFSEICKQGLGPQTSGTANDCARYISSTIRRLGGWRGATLLHTTNGAGLDAASHRGEAAAEFNTVRFLDHNRDGWRRFVIARTLDRGRVVRRNLAQYQSNL